MEKRRRERQKRLPGQHFIVSSCVTRVVLFALFLVHCSHFVHHPSSRAVFLLCCACRRSPSTVSTLSRTSQYCCTVLFCRAFFLAKISSVIRNLSTMASLEGAIVKSRGSHTRNTALATVLINFISTLVGIIMLEDGTMHRLRNISRPRRK